MVISNLNGGLGNQMFQYAVGRAVSLKLGTSYGLSIDMLSKNIEEHNSFRLGEVFGIHNIASNTELMNSLGGLRYPIIRKFCGKLKYFKNRNHPEIHFERNFQFDSQASKWLNTSSMNHYFQGYWQSWKYFEGFEEEIKKDFIFRGELNTKDRDILVKIKMQTSIGLHVRRGDYTTSKSKKIFTSLDSDYYIKSINFFQKKFPECTFFCFSDDIKWVKLMLSKSMRRYELIDWNNAPNLSFRDMQLMTLMDHNIIANSTFSWWSAWLNGNPNKIVISPKKWFIGSIIEDDLCPKAWIKI